MIRGLRPASQYDYPKLRRMTAGLPVPNASVAFHLTPEAAARIEEHPQILLHHRLYNMDRKKKAFVYWLEGRAVCALETRNFFPLESIGMSSPGEVNVFTPEETPDDLPRVNVPIEVEYPAHFLPFDLSFIKVETERALPTDEDASEIYLGADPFEVYQSFHWLTRFQNSLRPKMLGMRRILEVGSGLGIMSFIISQLLPVTRVTGVDINSRLVIEATKIRRVLHSLPYDVSKVGFLSGDIAGLDEPVAVGGYDAVVGFFPLAIEGNGVSYAELISVFHRLKKGALVFQLHIEDPLKGSMCESAGFRKVQFGYYPSFPFHVFERL